MKFIVAATDETESFRSLCLRFGISRKTGYKWLERYAAGGAAGLEERARVARKCPHRTPDEQTDLLLTLRKEKPYWGPKKLRLVLVKEHPELAWPAASTIGDLLQRHGLIHPRRRRVRVMPATQPLGDCVQPNDTWCVDFKGHFPLTDGTRCYPLTLTDAFSRYLIKNEAMLEPTGQTVRRAFELAFREFGLPRRIRSDNGPPFASLAPGGLSMLSVWWTQLGILHERIEPGKPQQNGRHERFHRTLKLEALEAPAATVMAQQRIFDLHRHQYNDRRPHEALDGKTPAQLYSASQRPYPLTLASPSYSDDFKVRWSNNQGRFSWRGEGVLVHACAANQPVGIRQISETEHEAYYGPILIGYLDERDAKPKLRKERRSVPSPDAEPRAQATPEPLPA